MTSYRRVQDAYVLTNDLEGMAAHQARIAAWEDDLEKIVMDRENLWRSVVAKGNQLGKIKFPAGAYDKLTQTELANLADNDQPDSDTKYINTAQASDAVRREVQEFNTGGSMRLDSTKVGVMSSTQAHLVLPDGSTMPFSSSWLGQTSMFTPHPYVPPGPGAPPALPMAPSANLKALVFHADKIQSAKDAVAHVKQLGVGELWLETRDPAVLRAAVEFAGPSGVKVCAAIRPWIAGPSTSAQDIDRTATGYHGPAFDARKADYVALGKFWDEVSAYPPANTRSVIAEIDDNSPAMGFAHPAGVHKGGSGGCLVRRLSYRLRQRR